MFGCDQCINPEGRCGRIILQLLAFTGCTTPVMIWFWFKDRRALYGFLLPLLPAILLLFVLIPNYLNKSNYYQKFDPKVWRTEHPVKMLRYIAKSEMLIGKSKKQVEAILGNGIKTEWGGDKELIYHYYDPQEYTYLGVTYVNSKVTDTYFGCDCD